MRDSFESKRLTYIGKGSQKEKKEKAINSETLMVIVINYMHQITIVYRNQWICTLEMSTS